MTSWGYQQHQKLFWHIVIYALLLFLLIGSLYVYFNAQKTDRARELTVRAYELSDFFTPSISIDNSVYLLAGTTVRDSAGKRAPTSTALTYLRTADYVTRTRLDPLMALPEVDTDNLRLTVQELERYTDDLAPHFPKEEMEHIENTLHPTTFLKTLPELESKRRTLLESPTPTAVREYDAALARSIATYKAFTDTLLASLPDIVTLAEKRAPEVDRQKKDGLYYIFPAGETSMPHLRAVVTQLNAVAKRLERKRAARFACFAGDSAACPSLATTLHTGTTVQLNGIDRPSSIPDTLPEQVAEVRAIVTDVFAQRPEFVKEIGGFEAIVLSKDRCVPTSTPLYYATWHSREWQPHGDRGMITFRHKPIHDLFFYSAERGIEEGSSAYFANALENELPYLHQSLGNLYMCPDNGAVAARLGTLAFIRTTLDEDPIFSALSDTALKQPSVARLAERERQINTQSIVSEERLATYLSEAATLLREEGEKGLGEMIGERNVRTLEDLLLLARAETPYFDEIIATVADINKDVPLIIKDGGNILLDYLYISRSGYMQLLLGFNDTVTDSNITFFENRNAPSLESYGLHSYHETMNDMFSREEIVDLIIRSDAFYRN